LASSVGTETEKSSPHLSTSNVPEAKLPSKTRAMGRKRARALEKREPGSQVLGEPPGRPAERRQGRLKMRQKRGLKAAPRAADGARRRRGLD
jgi:hypothetical protein